MELFYWDRDTPASVLLESGLLVYVKKGDRLLGYFNDEGELIIVEKVTIH